MDIKGAFDTIKPGHIKQTLLNKQINPDLVEWYHNYITHRNIIIQTGDNQTGGTIDVGFPQGGVCSAKFWIIAFDKALEIINNSQTRGYGFADDLCIIIGGNDLKYMQQQVQKTLNTLNTWSHSAGLEFSKEKTVTMVFHPKNRKIITNIKLGNDKLKTVDNGKIPWRHP